MHRADSQHFREQNIQVNALSTTLLASLLLPYLKAERANRSSPAHLSIAGSMKFAAVKLDEWAAWKSEKGEGILEHLSNFDNWPGPEGMYGATKLLVTYACRELAERARGSDGRYVTHSSGSQLKYCRPLTERNAKAPR